MRLPPPLIACPKAMEYKHMKYIFIVILYYVG